MPRTLKKFVLPLLVVGFLTAPAALAQPEEKPWVEPGITMLETSRPLGQWGLGLLFLIACGLIGFKNPHRSHLD